MQAKRDDRYDDDDEHKSVKITFELPGEYFPVKEKALCRSVQVEKRKNFGSFKEKTLECNVAARAAIDQVCEEGGFTQAWEPTTSADGFLRMRKIPVVILVRIMLGLPEELDDAAQSLVGAYAIGMNPHMVTCMNVIVGRRPNANGEGFSLDKFSLCAQSADSKLALSLSTICSLFIMLPFYVVCHNRRLSGQCSRGCQVGRDVGSAAWVFLSNCRADRLAEQGRVARITTRNDALCAGRHF